MKKITQILLILSAIFLFVSIFVPIWRIDLDAPQYPEGLRLLIYSNKLAGAVDIINGLNHYIGMKTLHENDFIEFTVLPYIILFFSIFSIATALMKSKKMLSILFFTFVAFGIIAMVDFWRWEYDYGHNLNPAAAIIVPGMAYQPPLIGFKQLLNFGAYSIPDIGGVLFILSGIFMLIGMYLERKSKKLNTALNLILISICFGGITGCSNDEPVSVKYNSDPCDFCRMTIVDPRFSCELKTNHGKAYKFDDIDCMTSFVKEQKTETFKIKTYFASNYLNNNALINIENLIFIQGNGIASPMGGGIAAFSNLDSAIVYKNYFAAKDITWEELLSKK